MIGESIEHFAFWVILHAVFFLVFLLLFFCVFCRIISRRHYSKDVGMFDLEVLDTECC